MCSQAQGKGSVDRGGDEVRNRGISRGNRQSEGGGAGRSKKLGWGGQVVLSRRHTECSCMLGIRPVGGGDTAGRLNHCYM